MRRDEDQIDPNQPALIVTYGNTKRKHRPLDRDVIMLGRSPSCDLGLVSPEVAPVHCVIVRLTSGWRIRDCSGRPGTCVNGKSIDDEELRDGDVIQVGSFSFQAHLPGPRLTPAPGNAAVAPSESLNREHLQRSRRNLAEHALRLRRQVRELDAVHADIERRQADLDQQEMRVRAFQREQEARAAQLEQRRALEKQAAEPRTTTPPPAPLPVEWDRRRRELAHYAAHLRRWAGRLQAQQEELRQQGKARDESLEQMHQREQQVEELLVLFDEAKRADEEERAGIEAELSRYRLEMQRERAQLAEERAELARLRAVARPEPAGEHADEAVRNKLERVRLLRQEIAERRQVPLGKGPRSRQLKRLQIEERPVS